MLLGLCFVWGNFLFDGIVEGMEENVEFFLLCGEVLCVSMVMMLV